MTRINIPPNSEDMFWLADRSDAGSEIGTALPLDVIESVLMDILQRELEAEITRRSGNLCMVPETVESIIDYAQEHDFDVTELYVSVSDEIHSEHGDCPAGRELLASIHERAVDRVLFEVIPESARADVVVTPDGMKPDSVVREVWGESNE